jgi:hypothetical protein
MRGEACDPKGLRFLRYRWVDRCKVPILQHTRSLTSEYGKRNVGGDVLAVCSGRGGRLTRPLAVLRFGQHHAGA